MCIRDRQYPTAGFQSRAKSTAAWRSLRGCGGDTRGRQRLAAPASACDREAVKGSGPFEALPRDHPGRRMNPKVESPARRAAERPRPRRSGPRMIEIAWSVRAPSHNHPDRPRSSRRGCPPPCRAHAPHSSRPLRWHPTPATPPRLAGVPPARRDGPPPTRQPTTVPPSKQPQFLPPGTRQPLPPQQPALSLIHISEPTRPY